MDDVVQQLFSFQGIILLIASAVIALLLIALVRKFALFLSWIIIFLSLFLGGMSLYDNDLASHITSIVNPVPENNQIPSLGDRVNNVWERVKIDLQVLSSKVNLNGEEKKNGEPVNSSSSASPQ